MSNVATIPTKRKPSILKKHWVLIASMGIFGITVAVLLILSIRQNQGHLVYALDDAYIHMAIAKNYAQYGIWGVTKYGFTSSSSSLLQSLLLSVIYFVFGVNEVSPLILNVIFATLTVCLIYALLRRYKFTSFYTFTVLMLIIFFTPLPALVFSGMEHILHALITISFVYLAAQILSKDKSNVLECSLLLILAPLVTMARYEGLFLIFVVGILFAIRRRLLYSSSLLGLAIIPIAIYGVISIMNGWYFLPNSVLVKGNAPMFSLMGIGSFFYHFGEQIVMNSHILILVSVALLLFILQFDKEKSLWKDTTIMLIIFIETTLLHMLFASTGWFFRYEAYLVALGIFVIAIGMREYLSEKLLVKFDKRLIPKYAAIALIILLVILPFVGRGAISFIDTPEATHERYLEHVIPALFLKEFYLGDTIAINDIGAISFYSDVRILDMYGLGNIEPLSYSKEGFDKKAVQAWAEKEGAVLAYVQIHWDEIYPLIPDQWIKVAQWEIPENVVFCDTKFVWFCIDPEHESTMIGNLRDFSKKLPKDIKQSGNYIDTQER